MVAEVIIDISHKNLDHTFSYRIPERLKADVQVGSKVEIPFGKGDKIRTGYVVELGEEVKKENASYTLKEIAGIVPKSVSAEDQDSENGQNKLFEFKDGYAGKAADAVRKYFFKPKAE